MERHGETEMVAAPFGQVPDPAVLLPDVVAVRWSMVTTGTRESVGGGLDVLSLEADGRIRTSHQFIG
jgi:hypothetical protein